jgi:preprotein translocase subunit SecD
MFHRNETQAFIDDQMNTEADQAFLRQEARRIDESGLEKARREELNAHKLAAVEAKRVKDAEKAEKVRMEKERLALIGIETNHDEISKMTDLKLKDQLELHRRAGDKEVPLKSKLKVKADRLTALLAAVDRFEARINLPASVSTN